MNAYYLTIVLLLVQPLSGHSQSLPGHQSIDILIVSDEVNPHGLPDSELMQPGDLSNSLNTQVALNLNSVTEIATNDIQQASALMNLPANDNSRPEVMIYFAHRIPNNGNNANDRQAAFVAATTQFLQTGGGVVVFHHGIYRTTGKQEIQGLFGSEATGSVPWDTVNGQDIINVSNGHFIATHQVNYTGTTSYQNPDHGINLANYPFFNNTPDERYPQMDFLSASNVGCEIEPLFQTNYDVNGNQHLLGYSKQCPSWLSKVVVYQPGEYQPNATSGRNFQILLNAIYYVSDFHWDVIFKHSFDS